MKKLFGLGKGLNSLIPTGDEGSPKTQKENVFYVEINKIKPNPDQPRRDFDEESLADLAKSVRKYGILQPLLVTKVEDHSPRGLDVSYVLLAGERRLRAAQKAGLPHVPVIIRDDFNEHKTRLEVALIENVQREDLNPVEEAFAYDRLQKEFGLTHREIAEKVSKSREVVSNSIRLLSLPDDMKKALSENRIGRTQARALLAITDISQQRTVFNQIIAGALTSGDVEELAAETKRGGNKPKRDNKFLDLEKNLSQKLNAPIVIRAGAAGGKIVIRFATLEDLNNIAKSIID